MSEEMTEQVTQPEIQEEVIQEAPVEEIVEETIQEEAPIEQDNAVRNLREAKEREMQRATKAEYERDQLAKYVENIQRQMSGGQQQPQNDLGIEDDDYVEGKHLGKVTAQMKQMQNELQQWKNYSEETTAELKLNSEFSDFNDVVTEESVKAFIKEYPEMRGSIQNSDPLYNRGKATYRLIKKFMGDKIKPKVNKVNQAMVQNNTGKPRPTSSINADQNSPLSKANLFANGYNEDVGAALEQEMYDAISKY